MSALLQKVNETIAHLKAQGASQGEIAKVIALLVNSPILAAAVAATPTKLDDFALSALKLLFPLT